ncbi:hypothetical protein WA158_002228 [Blastocystis sp. Blastoise]
MVISDDCQVDRLPIHITRRYTQLPQEENVTFYQINGNQRELIYKMVGSEKDINRYEEYDLCSSSLLYMMVIDDVHNHTWGIKNDIGWIQISYNNIILFTYPFSPHPIRSVFSFTYSFSPTYSLMLNSQTYLSPKTSLLSFWNTDQYTYYPWKTIHFGDSISYGNSITHYYLCIQHLPILCENGSYILQLQTNQGIILYFQGIEYYRYNMPIGIISNNTYALNNIQLTSKLIIQLSGYLFSSSNRLLLGIETHKALYSTTNDTTNLFITPLLFNDPIDHYASIFMNGTSSLYILSIKQESPEVLFDGNIYTSLVLNYSKADIIYSFGNNCHLLNLYSIGSSSSLQYGDPKSWSLYGYTINHEWELLDKTSDYIFKQRNYREIREVNNILCYTQYKLSIEDSSNEENLSFSLFEGMFHSTLEKSIQLYEHTLLTGYIGITYIYEIPSFESYTNYTSSSLLPKGIYLNPLSGILEGYPLDNGIYIYTITAYHKITKKSRSTIIKTQFSSCDISQQLIEIKIEEYNYFPYDYISIYAIDATTIDNKDKLIYLSYPFISNITRIQRFCLSPGLYKVYLGTKKTYSWKSGHSIEFNKWNSIFGFIHLYTYIYDIYNDNNSFIMNTNDAIPEQSINWQYTQKTPPNNWISLSLPRDFQPYLWKEKPVSTSSRWYFRHIFTIQNELLATGFILDIYRYGDVIIYINSKIIFNTKTMISKIPTDISSFSKENIMSIMGPLSYLQIGVNIICILFENPSSLEIPFVFFNVNMRYIYDNTSSIRYSKFKYQTIPLSVDIDNLFDNNDETEWISALGVANDVSIIIQFPLYTYQYITHICLTSDNGILYGNDPTEFYVYSNNYTGINNFIQSFSNIKFKSRKEKQCFHLSSIHPPSNQYRIRFTKYMNPNNNFVSLSELSFNILSSSINILSIPKLQYMKDYIEIYDGYPISQYGPTQNIYTNYTISPLLPQGLSIDMNTGYLSGIIDNSNKSQYIEETYFISAYDIRRNIQNISIQFLYLHCDNQYSVISLYLSSSFSSSSSSSFSSSSSSVIQNVGYSIYNQKGNLLEYNAGFFPLSSITIYFCITLSYIEIAFSTLFNNNINPSTFYIYRNNMQLAQINTSIEQCIYTYTIPLQYLIHPYFTSWSYTNDTNLLSSDWINTDFNYSDWPLMSLVHNSFFPSTTTTYFRTSFFINKNDPLGLILIRIYSSQGFILYLNEQEIYRFNMPIGNINSSTSSLISYESNQNIILTYLSRNMLFHSGMNSLCFEYHLYNIDKPAPLLTMTVENHLFIYNTIYDTIFISYPIMTETQDFLIDNKKETIFYIQKCSETSLYFISKNNEYSYINCYTFTSGNRCNTRHPSDWILEASLENETWTQLDKQIEIVFEYYHQDLSFCFYNDQSYKYYRFSIKQCNNNPIESIYTENELDCDNKDGSTGFQLSRLSLYSQKMVSFCVPQDDFPGALNNTIVIKNCDSYYTGIITGICINENIIIQKSNCTLLPLTSITYPSSILSIESFTSISIFPIIEGAEYICSIIPSLPSQLSINSRTGEIFGYFMIISSDIQYQVTCRNNAGYISTYITLNYQCSLVIIFLCISFLILITLSIYIYYVIKHHTNKMNNAKKNPDIFALLRSSSSISKNKLYLETFI